MQPSKTTSLVFSAGSMARSATYALMPPGCRSMFIHSRTLANAQAVAAHSNGSSLGCGRLVATPPRTACCRCVTSRQPPPSPGRLASGRSATIISCAPAMGGGGGPPADFKMLMHRLRSATGGGAVVMVLDVAPVATGRPSLGGRPASTMPPVGRCLAATQGEPAPSARRRGCHRRGPGGVHTA